MSARSILPGVEALEAPAEENLAALVAAARRERILVHCHERVGRQVVLVMNEAAAERVRVLHAQLREAGALRVDASAVRSGGPGALAWIGAAALTWPVTMITLAAMLVVFALSLGGFRTGIGPWLLMLPDDALIAYARGGSRFDGLLAPLTHGAPWRWFTPALLHDGVMHLLGNAVLFYWFGIRIESRDGPGRMIVLVLLTMLSGNLLQFLWAGTPFFGGLSGVVYGLFGYALVAPRVGGPTYAVHPGLFGLLVLLLLVASLGMLEPFGLHIGNGAHWGGLFGGMLLALLRHGGGATPEGDST